MLRYAAISGGGVGVSGFRIRRRRLEEAGIGFDPDGGDGGVTIVGEWWRSATLTVDREIDGYVRVLLG